MSIDITQFHAVFFEESFEGLEAMESSLLGLADSDDPLDLINSIFRAAHSIKGGSATFGFQAVSDFTHVMETLLDEMRNGEREVTPEAVELLLDAVDLLNTMLTQVQDDEPMDEARVSEVKKQLEDMLGSEGGQPAGEPASQVSEAVVDNGSTWRIQFKPHKHLLRTGNEPVRMFRELEELGSLKVLVDTSALPDISVIEPEDCYLSWDLELTGEIDESQITEVFEWVDGDCDLEITRTGAAATTAAQKDEKATGEEAESGAESSASASAPVTEKRSSEPRRGGNDRRSTGKSQDAGSIRVGIDKVDALINMVGELVITQSMLGQIGENLDGFDSARAEKLRVGLSQLERNTREMQEAVMRIRMLPISFAFNRFPRVVHDYCRKSGKKIELVIAGEGTELDKTVMEKINDPLVHLVRNSMDHGIETPEKRVAAGKPETGYVGLNAYHQGGNIVIEITDDGAGLNKERIFDKAIEKGLVEPGDSLTDEQVYDLLFMPGFSTAKEVTDVSGRGVGMDVVRRNIKSLGGSVEVRSAQGQGSTFIIRLPLTLAILDGQLVRVGDEMYIVPLTAIVESIQIRSDKVNAIAGKAELYRLRDEYIPIVRLHEAFGVDASSETLTDGLIVVVEGDGQRAGLFVDDLLSQQQVVIKSLETNFRSIEGISGATILGDGTVALIADISGLVKLAHHGVDRKQLGDMAVA